MPFDESLRKRLSSLRIRTLEIDARYLATYPLFLDFFRTRIAVKRVAPRDAKIAVVLVYSWMGQHARLDPVCWDGFERASSALQSVRRGEPDARAIEALRSFVGGSLVATSKFLHLLDPDTYAMWDQHVARAAYRYRHRYQYNRVDRYLEYLRDLRELEIGQRVRQRVRKVIGDDASPLRVKEFALFHLGISELTSSSPA
jgi:hypothetical protein